MDHIIISDGAAVIAMPPTKTLTIGGEEVGKTVVMASGKKVKETVGFRVKLSAEWNWLPAQTMQQLHHMLRQGGFFRVQYPDPEAGGTEGMFEIPPPTSGIFKFESGSPRWKDVALEMTAQEVQPYADNQ